MKHIFLDKQFQRIFAIPTGIWLLLCFFYISTSVGWGNLSAFLISEIAVLVVGLTLPPVLAGLLYGLARSTAVGYDMVERFYHQGIAVEAIVTELDQIKETIETVKRNNADNHQTLQHAISAIENTSEGLAGKVGDAVSEISKAGADNTAALKASVEDLINMAKESANTLDLNEIHQQTALLGFINVVLNDMNVAATRLLVRLMEVEGRPKNEIKDFIQGLVNAYSVGDRGVFFSVLNHQLSNNMERMSGLQVMVNQSPDATRDLSKIMKEMKEVISLFQKVDDADITKTICDTGALDSLSTLLDSFFNMDGSSKDTAVY